MSSDERTDAGNDLAIADDSKGGPIVAKDAFTYLVGGKAGEGVKSAALITSAIFSSMGRSVFQNDDYQSLIRGGHNFSTVTSYANRQAVSHYMQSDDWPALNDWVIK